MILARTRIDVLPSKNQALCEYCTRVSYVDNTLLICTVLYIVYFVFIKSCEKGLITKEYIVMDVHLNFAFKQALHFTIIVIELFNSGTKLQLLPQHYEPAFFLNASPPV